MQKIKDLIPAIVQETTTGRVLMLAYVNQQSYDIMQREGRTCFWSRSRGELWRKGEKSGDIQIIDDMAFDCDNDTLLIKVTQKGKGACHTGAYSCFDNEKEGFSKINRGKLVIPMPINRMEEGAYSFFSGLGAEFVCKEYEAELANIRSGGESKTYNFECEGAIYVRVRSRDIPAMIDSGEGDIATVAEDMVREYELGSITPMGAMSGRGYKSYRIADSASQKFGFPASRYCLIGAKGEKTKWADKIANSDIITVATEYPYISKRFLERKYPNTTFDMMSSTGKTENAIRARNADAIIEIVGSGETLRKNNLEVFMEAFANPTMLLTNNAAARLNNVAAVAIAKISGI